MTDRLISVVRLKRGDDGEDESHSWPRAKLRNGDAQRKRDDAEFEARHNALKEYHDKWRREHYQRNPEWLQSDLKWERERDAYLRERGFKPLPSIIPKGLAEAIAKTSTK